MRFGRFSLQSKINIIIATTVVLVVGISTYIAMWLTRDPVEAEIYRKALAQARLTAHDLSDKVNLQNAGILLKSLRQAQHDHPGVVQSDVFLHGAAPSLVATTNPAGEHLELDHLSQVESYNAFYKPDDDQVSIETPDGRFWIISSTIRAGGEPVGCLDLKVSKSSLNLVTWDLVRRNLLLMFASLGAVMLMFHLFFLRSVRSPIKEIIQVMEAAESGQLNVRARLKSRDEIGLLTAHLNRMLRRIENFNAQLGGKVQEATAELASRNEELRRINEELFETQKDLARSERLAVAGQLAASLAHEIGSPLNSISGHVQLLARRKIWDETAERRLQIIEKQIDSIVRTVKQLLSWTRKFDLQIAPLDLRHVLDETLLLSSPALQFRNIKVSADYAQPCPTIYGDAGYLRHVFLNLINNSMDAMPHGGGLLLRLRYPARGDREQVAVEVEDTGIGMNAETLAHIFEPMVTTKYIGTGAGLGLAIAEQIVRQHAGSITVESKTGQGTCFTILLPVDCRERLETTLVVGGSGKNLAA
jgi:two-component system, NtrC family, sensor kinase